MADCEAPSFSLGLDFLFDSEPQFGPESTSPKPRNDDALEEEREIGSLVADSDPDLGSEPVRVLKRLRRGLPRPPETTPLNGCDLDDDIEDFSSEENCIGEMRSSTQCHTMYSSSKISLNWCGVITKPSSDLKSRKSEPSSTITASTTTETCHSENLFTKLKVSPVRRFQLIDCDSDSDDPTATEEDIITGCNKANQSSMNRQSNATDSKSSDEQTRKGLESKAQSKDLWKDFTPIKSFLISTPALDEICEEYFSSVKDKNVSKKRGNDNFSKSSSDSRKSTNGQSIEQSWNETKPFVPAHRYYLHHDPRIRKLVCDHLPNFFPLGIDDDIRNRLNGASAIDYIGQFGSREISKRQATQQVDPNRNANQGRSTVDLERNNSTQSNVAWVNSRKRVKYSTGETYHSWIDPKQSTTTPTSRARKTSKKEQNMPSTSSAREGFHDSGSWVDPRSSAGGSEVSTNSQSGGHWFTGPNGRKVYINKNGQELTGQMAYRQYKRDRGGNGKTKRKTASKKKKT